MPNFDLKTFLLACIAVLLLAMLGILTWTNSELSYPTNPQNNTPTTLTTLTQEEAQDIAEKSCIKGGEALAGDGTYNPNSKTWWFDANLNSTREGCNPACVVSEETRTAEINWRCTGLNTPPSPDSSNP